MRVRIWVRTVMVAVALVSTLMGVATGIQRRRESFKRLAAYHLQAHYLFVDRLVDGDVLPCGFRTQSELEKLYCERGPEECRAHRASIYHYELSEKYGMAARRPWLPVPSDPSAPPDANPQLTIEPYYYELANDEGTRIGLK
jgi:hypothetical protein